MDLRPMDLLDPASVDAFADGVLTDFPAVHILVDGAGVMAVPLRRDPVGPRAALRHEPSRALPAHRRLWPALVAADAARVVSVSSWGHRQSDVVWDDIAFERREYTPMLGYGQSKTANVLLAVEADRRGRNDGVRAFAVHPGSIVTPLARHLGHDDLVGMGVVDADGNPVLDPARNMKTPEQGAATSVWCAVSPQLDGRGGVYCENCDVAPLADPLLASTGEWANQVRESGSYALGVLPYAVDPDSAARLWELSERLVTGRCLHPGV